MGNKVLIGIGIGVAALCAIPILIGFWPAGIVAGSIAAGIHSAIGVVSAGSAFATMTSLGMKGVFEAGVIAGTVVAGVGACGELKKDLNSNRKNSKDSRKGRDTH